MAAAAAGRAARVRSETMQSAVVLGFSDLLDLSSNTSEEKCSKPPKFFTFSSSSLKPESVLNELRCTEPQRFQPEIIIQTETSSTSNSSRPGNASGPDR